MGYPRLFKNSNIRSTFVSVCEAIIAENHDKQAHVTHPFTVTLLEFYFVLNFHREDTQHYTRQLVRDISMY